jgi:glutamate-1-semialdehyde 2,1-aminomutase
MERYKESERLHKKALELIPLGAQTFSKSKTQYPFGISPYFITHGQGSYVWDVDGNKYLDFVNSLAAINLGYNDPDVLEAVKKQLEQGTIFSLSHPIELELAELLIEHIPCAQKVRFGKNGSDVTSAAVRLARAYTGRDHVALCGYHGWHDWYIGTTTKKMGIPEVVQKLSHTFKYNDIESLEAVFKEYPNQVACVILEPMNSAYPENDFLARVKELAHKHGAVLVFDEIITGFRFALGGAQEYFGVVPDLATFGKAMANGYPISAIVGKADIMNLFEDIFYSFTFGGETLSIAAAIATIKKLDRSRVIENLFLKGSYLKDKLQKCIAKHELDSVLGVSGHPAWTFLSLKDYKNNTSFQIKTFLLQELFARGILTAGTHNLSYAHTEKELDILLSVYDELFFILQGHLKNNSLAASLRAQPLVPLFKVR